MGTGSSINLSAKTIYEPEIVGGDPTEDDRQKAQKIFDGNEDFIQKDRAAAWMGEEGIVRQRTLRAYMELYDFEGHNIVTTLRQVCQRLLLRAETQQVDRILVAFSKRWCDCNANHGFKSIGTFPPFLSRHLLTCQT
jgi:Sec7-like guanine-nucleotide exchange factor